MVRSSSEQLEEGEIVDDDDFEDISDNSIDSTFGKFVSSNENLRALSLSSNSDVEICENVKHRKKLLPRKCRIKHHKRRKRYRTSSDSSDSDISTCQDLKGKLKEAIRIDEVTEGQKNSLKARLKGMWSITNDKTELGIQEEKAPKVENQDDSDKIDDQELENLRIEALKTAVLNKFQMRKRKKATLDDQKKEVEPLETLENKENDTPTDEPNTVSENVNNVEKKSVHNTVLDIEEDEDVLRASLLAGLAKKITNLKANDSVIGTKPTAPILPIQVKPVLPKLPIKNTQIILKKAVQNRPKPQVKPLIINVDDSDSEEEIKQKQSNPLSKNKNLNVITNSVEKFLKEQRAKFEIETKKRFQIINRNKNKSILEKSAVKLLPRSQQIEYKQLLLKLKTAEKRKKARKIALQKLKNDNLPETQKKVEPTTNPPPSVNTEVIIKSFQSPLSSEESSRPLTVDVCTNPSTATEIVTSENGLLQVSQVDVCVKTAVEVKSPSENASKIQHSIDKKESDSGKTKSVVTNELTTLQKTLKDIKMQRNGSLQIKSKYQVLTPIIRKITATSNERKKQEQRIKKLLQEVNEARTSLAKSHEKFSALVKELVMTKEKVDSSYEDKKRKNGTISKDNLGNNHQKPERHTENDKKYNCSAPVTSTPIKQAVVSSMPEETGLSSIINRNSVNNESEDMDVCSSDETEMCQIDIVDPNDIDQIFTRKSLDKRSIPEYISPLDLNTYERYKHVDPLGIMCPYEVNGSCRDNDCIFKHYLKNNAKLQ